MKKIFFFLIYLSSLWCLINITDIDTISEYFYYPPEWVELIIFIGRVILYTGFLICGFKIYNKIGNKCAYDKKLFYKDQISCSSTRYSSSGLIFWVMSTLIIIGNVAGVIIHKEKNLQQLSERGYYLHADICYLLGAKPDAYYFLKQFCNHNSSFPSTKHRNRYISYLLREQGVNDVRDLPISMRNDEYDITKKLQEATTSMDECHNCMRGVMEMQDNLVVYSYITHTNGACIMLPTKNGNMVITCYFKYNSILQRKGWAQIKLEDVNGDGYSDLVVQYPPNTTNDSCNIPKQDEFIYSPKENYFIPDDKMNVIFTGSH